LNNLSSERHIEEDLLASVEFDGIINIVLKINVIWVVTLCVSEERIGSIQGREVRTQQKQTASLACLSTLHSHCHENPKTNKSCLFVFRW
jgi:hypothetical protein